MKKPQPIAGFFMIYFGLIVISFSVYSILYSEAFVSLSTSSNFSYSIALSSLTQIKGDAFHPGLSGAFLLFSLIITQISGIALLSYLLWFYWKLFGDRGEKEYSIIRAFKLTILISFISELILFLFFLYAIPVELTDFSIQKKSLAALSLSINSFNNAGFTHIDQFFDQGILEQNFILQIGILGGSLIGSLGIFVIYELFSPLKLRARLADPTIDWSFITKISVYGVILLLLIGSGMFFLLESSNILKEKNIVESVIASMYEITGARVLDIH